MTLKDIQAEIRDDVVFNSDAIAGIQWPELKKNANEVLALLNVNQTVDIFGLLKNGSFSQWNSAVAT
jgi:hypothetical protein